MFFKKHKQLPKECTESEKKCLDEFLDKLRYFTCTNCDTNIYSIEKPPICPKCGRKMLIVPSPKEHKSSKDVPSAKTQKIAPPLPQPPPIRVVKDGCTRIFHNIPKKSHPKTPHNQYGDNKSGSIDNSELDILLKDKLPKWADELTTGNVSEMRTNNQSKETITNTGLTKEEQEISDLTVQIWNKFVSLEQTHPSDLENVQQAIHQLQYILAMRTVRRDYPNQWISYKKGE